MHLKARLNSRPVHFLFLDWFLSLKWDLQAGAAEQNHHFQADLMSIKCLQEN